MTATAPSLARIHGIGLRTIMRREYSRIIRIWGQTLVPPAVTATADIDNAGAAAQPPRADDDQQQQQHFDEQQVP